MITRVENCNLKSAYTPNFRGLKQVPLKTGKVKESVPHNVQRSWVIQTVKDIVGEIFPVLDKRYRAIVNSSTKRS